MNRALCFAMLALAACRPLQKDGNEVKSLDNYARTDGAAVQTNHCGMDLESLQAAPAAQRSLAPRILASSDALKKEVVSALTAVPDTLSKAFFAAGGTIEVSPNAADLCADVPLTAAERRFAGEAKAKAQTCWRQEASGKPPVIYVQAEAAAIRHGLVRAFAFLYGELFVARLDGMIQARAKLSTNAQKLATDYRKQTVAVGDALLSDMTKKDAGVAARLKQYKQDDAAQYARIATAEALDSYFCSPATQLGFRQGFPLTYRAFVGKDQKGFASSFGTPWFQ